MTTHYDAMDEEAFRAMLREFIAAECPQDLRHLPRRMRRAETGAAQCAGLPDRKGFAASATRPPATRPTTADSEAVVSHDDLVSAPAPESPRGPSDGRIDDILSAPAPESPRGPSSNT